MHRNTINTIVGMARFDPRVKNDTITKGTYLPPTDSVHHGRFPDVYFETDNGALVIEVQLSPICLHRLSDRIEFYRREGKSLIWLTPIFDQESIERTWIADIWASQEQAIYSLDDALIQQSEATPHFLLKRTEYGGGEASIVGLDQLIIEPEQIAVKREWITVAGNDWKQAWSFTKDLLAAEKVSDKGDAWEICHALNTLFSIEDWQCIGSKFENPISVVHSYLESNAGMLGAGLIEKALVRYRPETLERDTTRKLIKAAKQRAIDHNIKPWGWKSDIAILRAKLFPNWDLPIPHSPNESLTKVG